MFVNRLLNIRHSVCLHVIAYECDRQICSNYRGRHSGFLQQAGSQGIVQEPYQNNNRKVRAILLLRFPFTHQYRMHSLALIQKRASKHCFVSYLFGRCFSTQIVEEMRGYLQYFIVHNLLHSTKSPSLGSGWAATLFPVLHTLSKRRLFHHDLNIVMAAGSIVSLVCPTRMTQPSWAMTS